MLGERVCELEPGEFSLRNEDLAQQATAFSLHRERGLPIVGRDEPEIDEDLADRAAELDSERSVDRGVTDDHSFGLPSLVPGPARPRSRREISG